MKVVSNKFTQLIYKTQIRSNRKISTENPAININDIRQSSYKLTRSKSGRKGHSLQRKNPIKYNVAQLANKISDKNPSEISVIYKDTEITQPYSELKYSNHQINQRNYEHSNPKTKFSSQKIDTFHSYDLQIEQQTLIYAKLIWQYSIKIKNKPLFQKQMSLIEKIIKDVILQLSKLKISQQNSSQFNNISLLRRQPDNFNRLYYQQRQDMDKQEPNIKIIQAIQQQPQFQIERLKSLHKQLRFQSSTQSFHIENQQSHKLKFLHTFDQNENEKKISRQDSSLKDITSYYNNSSSFQNKSSSQYLPSNKQNQNNNDRMFLKSIVKKVKNVASSFKESSSRNSMINSQRTINKNQSFHMEQEASKDNCCTYSNRKRQNLDFHYPNEDMKMTPCDLFTCDNVMQSQDISSNSENKRQVLNQIISMLNKKYKKQIQFNQDFKFNQ